MTSSKLYLPALAIGVIAGMRSMAAPAITSRYLADIRPASRLLRTLAGPGAVCLFTVLAAGEMAADKLPFIPARVAPGPLAGRALSGALCGAAVCAAQGRRPVAGALLGGLAAIAGAYGFYALRRGIGQTTGAPDLLLGVIEDALVAAGGVMLFDEHVHP